ncbi:MAG: methyltransferase domain-containing protein [Desulfobacterales bacterium]|nr:methyltransferase domain-containing protein [Desulfobacterales bacterium]
MTLPGRILTKARLKALKKIILSLSIQNAIDVGCGLGHLLQIFKDADIHYLGIDVSQKAVMTCKEKGLNAKIGKLEEEKSSYDLVASEGMLEHFLNFEPYVKDLIRISSLYILLMQPNHDSFMGRTLVYLARTVRGDKIVFEYNYRMKDYIEIFEKNGCVCIKNEPVFFDTSRLLLFKKNN